MKKPLFTGVCTALVTPFWENKVNYPMMDMLLRRQMDAGIQAVVVAGTTGEAPTLSDDEKRELIQRAKDFAGDGCAIIAGTGSNSTEHAISLSQDAEDAGADAVLVVSPYYVTFFKTVDFYFFVIFANPFYDTSHCSVESLAIATAC